MHHSVSLNNSNIHKQTKTRRLPQGKGRVRERHRPRVLGVSLGLDETDPRTFGEPLGRLGRRGDQRLHGVPGQGGGQGGAEDEEELAPQLNGEGLLLGGGGDLIRVLPGAPHRAAAPLPDHPLLTAPVEERDAHTHGHGRQRTGPDLEQQFAVALEDLTHLELHVEGPLAAPVQLLEGEQQLVTEPVRGALHLLAVAQSRGDGATALRVVTLRVVAHCRVSLVRMRSAFKRSWVCGRGWVGSRLEPAHANPAASRTRKAPTNSTPSHGASGSASPTATSSADKPTRPKTAPAPRRMPAVFAAAISSLNSFFACRTSARASSRASSMAWRTSSG